MSFTRILPAHLWMQCLSLNSKSECAGRRCGCCAVTAAQQYYTVIGQWFDSESCPCLRRQGLRERSSVRGHAVRSGVAHAYFAPLWPIMQHHGLLHNLSCVHVCVVDHGRWEDYNVSR